MIRVAQAGVGGGTMLEGSMMIAGRFHAMAALCGWCAETKAAILIDYIVHRQADVASLTFVTQHGNPPAMTQADEFLWAVAERLPRPALGARFQLFCVDTFDLFTPEEAAAEWQRRTSL